MLFRSLELFSFIFLSNQNLIYQKNINSHFKNINSHVKSPHFEWWYIPLLESQFLKKKSLHQFLFFHENFEMMVHGEIQKKNLSDLIQGVKELWRGMVYMSYHLQNTLQAYLWVVVSQTILLICISCQLIDSGSDSTQFIWDLMLFFGETGVHHQVMKMV